MTTVDSENSEQILDAEAELAASAASRPKRERAAPQPIQGQDGEGSEQRLAGVTRPAGGQSLTQSQPPRDLSRELEPSDIRIPQIKLCQSMSAVSQLEDEAIRPGNYYFTLDNTVFGPKVKVVAFEVFKNRAYFIPGAGLSCRSADMVMGIGDPGGDCESCDLKDWPPQGVKGGPKCRISYNFPCAVIPDEWEPGMPLQIGMVRLAGTSAPAGQQIIGMWNQSGKEWHELSFILGNVKKPYGNSSYQVSTAGWGGPPPETMKELLKEFADRVKQAQRHNKSVTVIDTDDNEE